MTKPTLCWSPSYHPTTSVKSIKFCPQLY